MPFCQHEHLWWHTRHKYLTKALLEGDYFAGIAAVIIAGGGRAAMIKSVEKLNDNMAANAPVETGALSRSGGPTVFDDGAVVYRRSPAAARKPGSNRGIRPHRPGGGAQRQFRGLGPLPPNLFDKPLDPTVKRAAESVVLRKGRR